MNNYTLIEEKKSGLSAPEKPPNKREGFMNNEVKNEMEDELRPEYDFAQMKGGVRGKYIEQYRRETNLVLLDADVAQAFPNDEAVNTALRLLMQIAQRQQTNTVVQQPE